MNDFEAVQQYGWLTFLVYFTLREIWPWFRDKAWPKRQAEQERESKRLQMLEERQIVAVETISTAVQEISKFQVALNVLLEQFMKAHDKHDQLTRDAITAIYKQMGVPRGIGAMANILTAAEAANFLRTEATDGAMLQLLPPVDAFIQRATGRDWTADNPINDVAKAAAGMLLVMWYDNPAQAQAGSETLLPYGLTNVLGQLEAEALKYRKYQFAARDGAGAIPLPKALLGDDVISLTGVYGVSGDQSGDFESEISKAGYILQSSGSDLSGNLYVIILKSPASDVIA